MVPGRSDACLSSGICILVTLSLRGASVLKQRASEPTSQGAEGLGGCIHVRPITCIPGDRVREGRAYEGISISVQKDVKLRLITDFAALSLLLDSPNLTSVFFVVGSRRPAGSNDFETGRGRQTVWGVTLSGGD